MVTRGNRLSERGMMYFGGGGGVVVVLWFFLYVQCFVLHPFDLWPRQESANLFSAGGLHTIQHVLMAIISSLQKTLIINFMSDYDRQPWLL